MLELNKLISTNKTIKVEHPSLEGFIVEVAYISKEVMKKLITKATTVQYDMKARAPIEKIDDDLFLKLYSQKLILGWEGLKVSYLSELVPIDVDNSDNIDDMLEYSADNAVLLLKHSSSFDAWLTSVISDVKNFNKSS